MRNEFRNDQEYADFLAKTERENQIVDAVIVVVQVITFLVGVCVVMALACFGLAATVNKSLK